MFTRSSPRPLSRMVHWVSEYPSCAVNEVLLYVVLDVKTSESVMHAPMPGQEEKAVWKVMAESVSRAAQLSSPEVDKDPKKASVRAKDWSADSSALERRGRLTASKYVRKSRGIVARRPAGSF